MSEDLVLHEYATSPFSEKVRVAMGLKALDWLSVEIPTIMPKPDYVPLTGGYRRTPSLQIGADIYCDTQLILAEIERRRPSPSLIPKDAAGAVWMINWWADRLFFQTTVPIIFGALGDQTPEAFIKDREKLSGRSFDTKAMAAAVEPLKGQWRAQAAWLDTQLRSNGSEWLLGSSPSLADAAGYMNFWFLGRTLEPFVETLTQGLADVRRWRERVSAVGHGAPRPLTSQEALDIARSSTPAAAPPHDPVDPLKAEPGDQVIVAADDYGRDPVAGALVSANPEQLTLAREDDRVGLVHVHFPRTGYIAVKV